VIQGGRPSVTVCKDKTWVFSRARHIPPVRDEEPLEGDAT
jgi:hypothetical protein